MPASKRKVLTLRDLDMGITGLCKSLIPRLRELAPAARGGITQPRNRTFADPCKDGDDIYGVVQDGQVGGQVAKEENHGRRPPSFLPCSIVAEISGTINRFNHLSSLSLSSSGEISRAADPKAGQQKACS